MSDVRHADAAERVRAAGPWFYDFELGGGVRTNPTLGEDLRTMHEDRCAMLRDAVGLAFPEGLCGRAVLDVGCHEGFFSHAVRGMGAGALVGVDLRGRNIAKAELAAELAGMDGARWIVGDAEDLVAVLRGAGCRDGCGARFPLTLVLGLMYHCENPVRVLRQAASATEHAMVVETQLWDEPAPGVVEWGRRGYALEAHGGFAVVDESRLHPTNDETGSSPLALCPSERAVRAVLSHCGFSRVDRIEPPGGGNEQLVRGKRGVFLARRADGARS